MLPARSKRYAGIDGETPRLQLASNWQLALIAVLMIGLLRVIFPQKALVEKLYDHEQLDELTQSYIENLHRTDPGNADLTILLGRSRRDQMDTAALERLLQPILATGNARQRAEARLLLLAAYERALNTRTPAGDVQRARARLVTLLQSAQHDQVPPQLAGAFAASAFRLDLSETGLDFLNRVAPGRSTAALEGYAHEALGTGRHLLAAEYFLLARRQAADRNAARTYFRQGIEALMAASRFQQALVAADRSLGDLADDPETLRFLIQTALAAGDPIRAARYAQRLVFKEPPPPPGVAP